MPFLYMSDLAGYGKSSKALFGSWAGGCDAAITDAVKTNNGAAFQQAVADWAKSGQLARATAATPAEVAAYFARPDVGTFASTMWNTVAAGGSPNVAGQQWPQPIFDVKDPNTPAITTCGETLKKAASTSLPPPVASQPWTTSAPTAAPSPIQSLPPPVYSPTYQSAPLPPAPSYDPMPVAQPAQRSVVNDLMQNKTVLIGGGAMLLLLGVLVVRKLTRSPAPPAYYPPYQQPYQYGPPPAQVVMAHPPAQSPPTAKNRRRR